MGTYEKPLFPETGKSGFVKNDNERSRFYDVEVPIELVHASDQFLEFVRIAFDPDHALVQGFLQGYSLHGNKGEVEQIGRASCRERVLRLV